MSVICNMLFLEILFIFILKMCCIVVIVLQILKENGLVVLYFEGEKKEIVNEY